jgi:hypothetical protein
MNAVIAMKQPQQSPHGDAPPQFDLDMLEAVDTADPASLDLAMLGPMRAQLQQMSDMGDELPPELFDLARKLEGVIGSLATEMQRRLDKLCEEKENDWQKAVKTREPIDARWIDDFRQFKSESRILESKLYPSDAADPKRGEAGNKPITVAATRSRVLMCWARLCDMMLPANDLPFRVEAPDDPDPEDYPTAIEKAMAQAAQQAQAMAAQQGAMGGQAAPPPQGPDDAMVASIAQQAAEDMQERVFAMAHRAGFKKHVTRMLFDTALFGCGIIKGPHPEIERKRKRRPAQPGQPAGIDFEVVETTRAGLSYVPHWFFWYDNTPTLGESSNTYEVQLWSRRKLEEFKSYPRVMTDVVDEILKNDECCKLKGNFREAIEKRNNLLDIREPVDDVYAVLEVHSIMDPEKFSKATGTTWDNPDPPLVHLWICNGRCIKWKITPLERDYRVDYYSTTIMRADDTIYGYGYAWMARGAQRITDGAMNATLANAGASVAPMFIVKQGKIVPNNENWKIAGLNVMSATDTEGPVGDSVMTVKIDSNVEENLRLVEMAQNMMDQDTLFNQIQQGNFNGEEMPASGIVMAANIGSVFQKAIASDADENCFQPLCERLIWWDTMYGKEPPEGEFVGKGIAATQLVAKDLALQHTSAFVQFTTNPRFAGMTDDYGLLEAFAHNIDGLPEGVVYDRDKAMANVAAIQQAQQQGDPAKAAQIASAERIAAAKIKSEETVAFAKMQTELNIERMRYQTALVELQTGKEVDIAKISAEVEQAARDDDTTRALAFLDGKLKANIEAAKLQATPSPYSAKD